MMTPNYTKQQLVQETALSDADMAQVQQCRRDHNRLGFAYQLGFVRLLNRFPTQLPFEILEELLAYISTQVALPAVLISAYQQRQQTISEHQQHIAAYLGLKPFDSAEAVLLAQFIFEEAC
jgi:AAA+ ATPase superfamily predicted ATPase